MTAHSAQTVANTPPRVAWTGGSQPPPYNTTTRGHKLLISRILREQIHDYMTAWRTGPDLDTIRIFWNRARHDAHATIRAYYR